MSTPSLGSGTYIVSTTNGSDFNLVVSGIDTTSVFPNHDSIFHNGSGAVANSWFLVRSSGNTPIVYDSDDSAYVAGATIAGASAPAKFWTGYVACEE
jgi:hypothetical protein